MEALMFKNSIAVALALVSFASVSARSEVTQENNAHNILAHVKPSAGAQDLQSKMSSFEYRKAVFAQGEGMMLTIRTNKGVFTHAIKAGDTESIYFNGTLEGLEIESADVTDGLAQANNKAKRFLRSGHQHNTKLLKELQDENHWVLQFKPGRHNTIAIKAHKN